MSGRLEDRKPHLAPVQWEEISCEKCGRTVARVSRQAKSVEPFSLSVMCKCNVMTYWPKRIIASDGRPQVVAAAS